MDLFIVVRASNDFFAVTRVLTEIRKSLDSRASFCFISWLLNQESFF